MTTAMEEIFYDKHDFNYDANEHRHPMHITERYFIYHLEVDNFGMLKSIKGDNGRPLRSPRQLRQMCMNKLCTQPQILNKTDGQIIPSNVYPAILSEAIYMREAQAIEWIVSTWPRTWLKVSDIIPKEDYIENDYLTCTFEREDREDRTSLVDCFVLGLLKQKPEAHLKCIDFTGFEKDRKLCKELCRLPILWMKPKDRTVEKIHEYMLETLDVSKDKVQRFLNRISVVYSNVDGAIHHGNEIDPITILLDLKMHIDDVPLGLSLLRHTPFRVQCSRAWMKPVPDVGLAPSNLGTVLDTSRIRYFEYEEPFLPRDSVRLTSLLDSLHSLHNLVALSLPNSIDVISNQDMATSINSGLRNLKHLQKLNFSYCNLKGELSCLLAGLRQDIEYLNLKDCRLNEDDMFFLVNWRPVVGLRELNLSCNNLSMLDQIIVLLLQKMSYITCLLVSFCSLDTHSQVVIARECKESSHLKVLGMQGYTPPPQDDILELLSIGARIRTMQKIVIFPEAYAFPGNNEVDRELNKYHTMRFSYRYLEMRGRKDIGLELN